MASSCGLGGGRFAFGFLSLRQLIGAFATIGALAGPSFSATVDSTKSNVEKLIAAAAQAEQSGDAAKSLALLHDAIRIDPENRVARWQLGQIRVDKQWVAVEEAQRRAAADPLQAEYRERRTAAADNPQGQLTLARWCRKKDLTDEALVHWANVLAADPKNDEALRALDLH